MVYIMYMYYIMVHAHACISSIMMKSLATLYLHAYVIFVFTVEHLSRNSRISALSLMTSSRASVIPVHTQDDSDNSHLNSLMRSPLQVLHQSVMLGICQHVWQRSARNIRRHLPL